MKRSGVFIELYVDDIEYYIKLFTEVLNFQIFTHEVDFAQLRKSTSAILLNAVKNDPENHFYKKLNLDKGVGVEIGIIVDNLESVYKKAIKFKYLKCTLIKKQEWGASDFRISTPDGYYLRITTD